MLAEFIRALQTSRQQGWPSDAPAAAQTSGSIPIQGFWGFVLPWGREHPDQDKRYDEDLRRWYDAAYAHYFG